MSTFLSIIGACACMVVFVFLVWIGFAGIKEYISRRKRMYAIKHRFDKPPMAKCYCIDCTSYSKRNGDCWKHSGWRVADNWFCWSAEPNDAAPKGDSREDG